MNKLKVITWKNPLWGLPQQLNLRLPSYGFMGLVTIMMLLLEVQGIILAITTALFLIQGFFQKHTDYSHTYDLQLDKEHEPVITTAMNQYLEACEEAVETADGNDVEENKKQIPLVKEIIRRFSE